MSLEEITMDGSILNDVKKQIGIAEANTDFDKDLIININTVLFTLWQMGIIKDDFSIEDNTATWESILLNPEQIAIQAMKTWVALKTKMIFDPPTSSVLQQAINANIDELTWRIYITENYVGEI